MAGSVSQRGKLCSSAETHYIIGGCNVILDPFALPHHSHVQPTNSGSGSRGLAVDSNRTVGDHQGHVILVMGSRESRSRPVFAETVAS